MKQICAISYDITNNKRRRKLVKLLEAFGRRVQFSVFEACLDNGQLNEVLYKAEKLINTEEGDSIRLYRLCQSCYTESVCIGGRGVIDWKSAVIV